MMPADDDEVVVSTTISGSTIGVGNGAGVGGGGGESGNGRNKHDFFHVNLQLSFRRERRNKGSSVPRELRKPNP